MIMQVNILEKEAQQPMIIIILLLVPASQLDLFSFKHHNRTNLQVSNQTFVFF